MISIGDNATDIEKRDFIKRLKSLIRDRNEYMKVTNTHKNKKPAHITLRELK